jgi:phosphoribosylanthranilate isomerase
MAEQAGAEAIGIVVYSNSLRSIPLIKAAEILRTLGPYTAGVLVTHTKSETQFSEILSLSPTAVQVSHPFDVPEGPRVKLIRVVQPGAGLQGGCDAVVIDESLGSGKHYNKEFAKKMVKESPVPVILAGGLTPDNVRAAIDEVRPYAVDVASGVEKKPGVKDQRLVKAFMKASGRC